MNNISSVIKKLPCDPKYVSSAGLKIRAEAMHRVSDIYGPIVYTHYGTINGEMEAFLTILKKDAYYTFC